MSGSVEEELMQLPREVIDGGWKALCTAMLMQSLARIERNAKKKAHLVSDTSTDYTLQGQTAEKWLEGGSGTISLEECCEAMGLDPDNVRNTINDRAYERRRKPDKDYTRVQRPRVY